MRIRLGSIGGLLFLAASAFQVGCVAESVDGNESDTAAVSTAPVRLTVGETAHFKDFDVTLRSYDVKDFDVGVFKWTGLNVKVCAVGTANQVTWGPWNAMTSLYEMGLVEPDYGLYAVLPWTSAQLYPRNTHLTAGACAEGIVPIFTADLVLDGFHYRNSLGDDAIWQLPNIPLPVELPVGQTAHFKNFDVTLRNVDERHDDTQWVIGMNVKVCAVGEANHVTWDPWYVLTPAGPRKAGAEEYPKLWSPDQLYPRYADLAPGACAEGIVPIDISGKGEAGRSGGIWFRYHDSMNDKSIWR
jgi:hypothetical protein